MTGCLAFDIGGANIKVASSDGFAHSRPFPLWQSPERLSQQLAELLAGHPSTARIGVTMTGELADCYESKQDGVLRIVEASRQVLGDDARYYQVTGQFVDAAQASEHWLETAASNWHALTHWVARQRTAGFLVDIGSTTVDLIPFQAGKPCSRGLTDLARIEQGELVYTGVGRSPVSCLLHSVTVPGKGELPLAQEVFATMQDVYLLAGYLPPNPDNRQTADGRPLTLPAARQRMSRLLCADSSELLTGEIEAITTAAASSQRARLIEKLKSLIEHHPELPLQFVVAGQGEWLAREIVETAAPTASSLCSVAELVDRSLSLQRASKPADASSEPTELSRCAPAYAVACLLEQWHEA